MNPSTYSLFVYPVIVLGLTLSPRGRGGPRFWSFLSAGGALFVGYEIRLASRARRSARRASPSSAERYGFNGTEAQTGDPA